MAKLDDGYTVTGDGEKWFQDFGIDCTELKGQRRLFSPSHIDWSERRQHLAFTLGALFAMRLFDLGWIQRLPASRAVRVTETGQRKLMEELGVPWTSL